MINLEKEICELIGNFNVGPLLSTFNIFRLNKIEVNDLEVVTQAIHAPNQIYLTREMALSKNS